MDYSLTGISYFFVSLALGLMSYRFFTHWQREKNKVSEFFFLFTSSVLLSIFFPTIGALFFAHDAQVLRAAVVSTVFLESFIFAIVAYLIAYIKFQKISPKLAFGIFLSLGFIAMVLTLIYPSYPYLDHNGIINWNIRTLPAVFRAFLFLMTLLSLLVVLAQQYKNAQSKQVRERSLGIMLIIFFGLFMAFADIILESVFKLPAISSVILGVIMSVIAFVFIILTRRREPQGLQNINNEIQS